ncbi:MAG: hypothetical protein ACK56U_02390, partial [Planctomyces sp.]
LLVVGCWLLVVGCWLLVVGCWLLVFSFQLLSFASSRLRVRRASEGRFGGWWRCPAPSPPAPLPRWGRGGDLVVGFRFSVWRAAGVSPLV